MRAETCADAMERARAETWRAERASERFRPSVFVAATRARDVDGTNARESEGAWRKKKYIPSVTGRTR